MAGELLRSTEIDSPRDKCAVVGVYSKQAKNVAATTLEGLIEQNHRGQEGSGIVVSNGCDFQLVKDSGLAEVVFLEKQQLPNLLGSFVAAGHDRYSTSGSLNESQPFLENGISLVHNGNLTNVRHLREKYGLPEEIDGAKSDSRMALAIINKQKGIEEEKILAGLKEFEGAYSFILTTKDTLYAARDPLGFRPLCLGSLENGGYAVASEPIAFFPMGGKFIREILPGETITINDEGVKTIALDKRSKFAHCIFELVYVANINSTVFGIPVAQFRLRQGEILSRHLPEDVDLIMSVPHSGMGAAEGTAASYLAKLRGIPYLEGLYTSPYRNIKRGQRTFIQPFDREQAARDKYRAIEYILYGKKVVMVDDSIVRGSVIIPVGMARNAGAKEIHLRSASPPIKSPCYFGVDMGSNGNDHDILLADRIPDIEERRKYLGVDSLYYLTWGEIVEAAVGNPVEIEDETVFERHNFCGSCFTGKYPIAVDGVISKH